MPQPLACVFGPCVALEAIRGDKTLAELVKLHDMHLNQIAYWRTQLLERTASVFGGDAPAEPKTDIKELNAKIGQQALEIDFCPTRSPGSAC